MPEEIITGAGIVSEGGQLTEVVINGVIYQGTAYSTISAASSKSVIAAVGGTNGRISTGSKTYALKDYDITAYSTAAGGGVTVGTGGTFIAENVNIVGSTGTSGGGIYSTGSVTIVGGEFSDNETSSTGGGAIRTNADAAVLSVDGTVFDGNYALGNGGAICLEKGSAEIRNSVFTDNVGGGTKSVGGAIYSAVATTIDNCSFSGNYSTLSGNAVVCNGSTMTIRNSTFGTDQHINVGGGTLFLRGTNNLAASISGSGGQLYADNASLLFTNTGDVSIRAFTASNSGLVGATFANTGTVAFASNQDLTGTAIFIVDGRTGVLATGLALSANQAVTYGTVATTLGTGALNDAGDKVFLVSYSGNTLSAVESDTITINGTGGTYNTFASYSAAVAAYPGFTGDYLVTAATTMNGTINNDVTNESTITVDGLLTLGTGSITGGSVVVDGSSFSGGDTVIANYGKISGTISVTGANYLYADGSDLKIAEAIAAGIVAGGATRADINGEVYIGSSYATIASSMSANDVTAAVGQTRNTKLSISADKTLAVKDTTIIVSSSSYSGGAVQVSAGGEFITEKTFISGQTATTGGGIFSEGAVTLVGSSIYHSWTTSGGGGFRQRNATASLIADDCVFRGNTGASGGAVLFDSGSGGTISDTLFKDNIGTNGGAIYNYGTILVDGCSFTGNEATSGSGNAIYNNTGGVMTIRNSVFDAGQSVYSQTGSVTFKGTVSVGGSITKGSSATFYVDGASMVFTNAVEIRIDELTAASGGFGGFTFNGAGSVKFSKSGGQDITGIAITVDGALYTDSDVTVATGVTGTLGSYTINGGSDHLKLKKDGTNLVLYLKADVDDDTCEASFTGGTSNLMTGGTITGAYVGIRNAAAGTNVENVITGGTVGNSLIGGALVSSGSTATLGTVSLTIAGTTDIVGGSPNGGMVYTAGYAYGANPSVLDSSATLTVTKSVLNLTEGSAPAQNLYAGAHARKGAYTVVNQTEINVSGGSFARVYGGGWAEKVGKSEVGSSTITVTGGTLDYIYAGGGNAEGGETVVTGAVNIAVSGDASVDIAFLAGKNQNCTTEGAVTMTLSGGTKTMSRVSGWNANGKENTSLTTLDLRTSLDVEYLDHVDVVRIAEGSTLNVSVDLWYDAASALKIDFDLDGALDTDWTAMSGVGMNIYRGALYTIDGGDVVYTYDGESGKLVNGTTESGYALEFTSDNKVKFVAATNL